jgi:hypothetical protein
MVPAGRHYRPTARRRNLHKIWTTVDFQRCSLDKPLRARFHIACRISYRQDFPTCTSRSARPGRSPAECDNIATKGSIAQGCRDQESGRDSWGIASLADRGKWNPCPHRSTPWRSSSLPHNWLRSRWRLTCVSPRVVTLLCCTHFGADLYDQRRILALHQKKQALPPSAASADEKTAETNGNSWTDAGVCPSAIRPTSDRRSRSRGNAVSPCFAPCVRSLRGRHAPRTGQPLRTKFHNQSALFLLGA